MKKLAIVTAVVALVTGFAATDAAANHRENHNKGDGSDSFQVVLQAPFIDVTTAPGKADSCKDAKSSADGICDGSEGRIASNGAYAVTIQGVAGADEYDLCLDINGDGVILDIPGTCDIGVSDLCTVGLIGEVCATASDCDVEEFVANAFPAGATLVFPGTDGVCGGGTCTAGLTGKACSTDAECVASGNLINDGVITSGTWLDVPFFEVRLAMTDPNQCTGDPVFRSGIVINN